MPDSESTNEFTCEVALTSKADEILRRLDTNDRLQVADTFRRLGLLYELGCTICDAIDVEKVTNTVLASLVRLVPLERCFVALLDGGQLRPVAMHQIQLSSHPDEWPVSRTMVRRVLDENVSLLTSDATSEPGFANVSSVARHNLKSVIAVPLGPKGRCIGLVYADNRGRTGSFSQLDLLFMTTLSHFIYLGIRNAREFARTFQELESAEARYRDLKVELLRRHRLIGSSPTLLHAYERVKLLAATNLPVLLSGETGTGKELLALTLHAESARKHRPFVAVNLAAVTESLVDSELFGHEKGAFTGAAGRRIGKLELANGGTLFLDEVADIPEYFQPKLLRAIERGEFNRIGGNELVRTNFRLVCATSRNLKQLVKEGEFREDLYFRLVGDEIKVPALRDRPEDIPALIHHVLKEIPSDKRFSAAALQCLQRYHWPGNVRQLRTTVHALVATSPGQVIEERDAVAKLEFHAERSDDDESGFQALESKVEAVEREHIRKALELSRGNKTQAGRMLRIAKQTLLNKIRQYGLE